ncbi:ribonuclease P protein component [Lyngbya confervoides]|uniref:Ribonuclease P protein component n=1 Tax=Lyngbya confervoides BDU141951 TaxID=1574623 RepID=A0ABD4T8L0_9CYAN|nr:ribonuclease P protein component [Lyngbya confervoides]MCM1984788.1 ribonuclease P protein component [Lyngbya confervoides BDU141951]
MLAKANRLRRFRDFSHVYKHGKRFRADGLALCTCERADGAQPTRIGIAVGAKVSKRAVVRNRIKRRLRSACRSYLPSLSPGQDLVIVARSAATQCDYSEFLRQLKQLFTNAELLHGD